ncbi:MAG TPA: DUF1622 domain-containing protein [Burkholderiaceae bacterium]|nr:DUF1622 domain-containing protein [Burkholderiaceae bacterium]
MEAKEFVELAGVAAEIAGVVLIIGGLVVASVRYALTRRPSPLSARPEEEGKKTEPPRLMMLRFEASDVVPRYQRYRQDIGRALLLGLEVLVAADIIRTVAFTPTLDSVAVLAIIVAIRTFLSWSLGLELEGRWPWQRREQHSEVPKELAAAE